MAAGDAIRSTRPGGRLGRVTAALVQWLPLGIVAVLWEALSRFLVGGDLLPPVSQVVVNATDLLLQGEVLGHLSVSLFRVAIGLSASIVGGVLLGIGMAQFRAVEDFFDVLLTMTYAVPKTALVPLAILWLGVGTGTAVLVIFLGTLVPIVVNTYNGASSVDEKLRWSAEMLGTSDRRRLRKVVLPATYPAIFTGVQQAIPFSFIVLISAEMVASRRGMGNLILSYGQLGNYDQMFAVIFLFSLVAFATVGVFNRLRSSVLAWE